MLDIWTIVAEYCSKREFMALRLVSKSISAANAWFLVKATDYYMYIARKICNPCYVQLERNKIVPNIPIILLDGTVRDIGQSSAATHTIHHWRPLKDRMSIGNPNTNVPNRIYTNLILRLTTNIILPGSIRFENCEIHTRGFIISAKKIILINSTVVDKSIRIATII